MCISGILLVTSVKACIHAIYPDLYELAATKTVVYLYDHLGVRKYEKGELTSLLVDNDDLP